MDKLISQRDAFGEALLEAGKKYKNVFVVTSDLGSPTKCKEFGNAFPDRYVDLGIAEQNAICVTAGAAMGGLRPFYCTFGVFLASNYGQIRQSIAYNNAPAVLVGTHGGLIGKDGASHQALEEIAIMSSLPNINIFQPADPTETRQIVNYLASTKEPAYLRISRHPQKNIHNENYQFKFNRAATVHKTSEPKFVIFSTGYITTHAMEAANILTQEGLPTDVVSFSTINPIDSQVINDYKEVSGILTIEDHNINGGLGSRISEAIAERGMGIRLKRMGMKTFGKSGDPHELYKKYGLDENSIVEEIKKFNH
jgi:transketolase